MKDLGELQHMAIIMDGNGRWATLRNLPRALGHRAGAEAVRRCIKAAFHHGIPWLTLYAFSSENWKRSEEEVIALTGLLQYYVRHELANLHKEGVKIHIIGDISRFGVSLQHELLTAQKLTQHNQNLNLVLALSYGGRDELVQATRNIGKEIEAGLIKSEDISESLFRRYLFTASMPDPDLIVRTSGECRLSNFLLWQSAYAEFVFLDVLWPDFNEHNFEQALKIFSRRERRFGRRPEVRA
ncbi:polyprenyl diphosphate synthase [Entomobacter blattae]|uniref:Isoprenyl transferase n=1 Tax=Entomobacter blattae TaxID=2762277 RepID=A0A7H1NSK7_9PROT|nr:polyprenyl diphosphate synthase [Entomobacter blattae]QNT78767.1 Ditrans,polycis-undecaprenyl-diphosphate synthase [Entomobacter blattae]